MPVNKYGAISRILAFLAVSSVIAAVGWSIRDYSVVAIGIPGLAAGHVYSWRRREASIRRSLILLLFMVLTVFLGGDILLSGLSDRLLLSRYIVYGLVLGSFDLMRKRNVLASLILGALLLVLVSELALNLWFLIFVALFTVLAVASEALGKAETEAVQTVVIGDVNWPSAVRIWLIVSALMVLVTAVLFLMMPRFASRQVTQANWLPSRLDLSIGGLVGLPSKPGAAVEPGILPSDVFGDSSASGYAVLGYTGSSADEIVMNVRSQISSYWRGMTLDEYDGRGWLSVLPQNRLRNLGSGEYIPSDFMPAASGGRVYWQVYYLLADQPNSVFAGYNPGRLYLPQLEQGLLDRGTLYRALSALPSVRPDVLRADRVVANDAVNLKLPPISQRTAVLAESIVDGAETDYDKAVRLERFLLANYQYKLNVAPLPPGRDAVDYFLFEQQSGYCAHFATAMAVMARHVGLPARVAAGYLPGYIDPLTGAHIVRVGDAHAWVEIRFRERGWVAFDPTPRADAAMGFIGKRGWLRFGLGDYINIGAFSGLKDIGVSLSLGKLSTLVPELIILTGALAVFAVVLWRVRSRQGFKGEATCYSRLDGETRRGMLAIYRKMSSILEKKGLPSRSVSEPPEEYSALVLPRIIGGREVIEMLTALASRAAYDPRPFSCDVSVLKQSLKHLRRAISVR